MLLLRCQDDQNIELSNHKLKSAALTCTLWSHTPPRRTETDRLTNTVATARRFVLTNASRA